MSQQWDAVEEIRGMAGGTYCSGATTPEQRKASPKPPKPKRQKHKDHSPTPQNTIQTAVGSCDNSGLGPKLPTQNRKDSVSTINSELSSDASSTRSYDTESSQTSTTASEKGVATNLKVTTVAGHSKC